MTNYSFEDFALQSERAKEEVEGVTECRAQETEARLCGAMEKEDGGERKEKGGNRKP